MQAVILAAGRGTRLRPLTYHVPKPLIRINGQNILEHNLNQLPQEIDECLIVVSYLGEQIINHFGSNYADKKITYIKQTKLLGTGHALHACRSWLNDRFLVMMGDNIYCREDIKNCLRYKQCLLAEEVNGKFTGGRIILNRDKILADIKEGTHHQNKSLINTALYVLTKNFFDYKLVPLRDKKEYGLPQTIVTMVRQQPVAIVKASFWLQITDLPSLKNAAKILRAQSGKPACAK